ncbi:MAG: cysteine desulfurase, partial [Candidatus Aenigmatarchaeota archaeon]
LRNSVNKNEIILTTIMEHHSNYVPWLSLRDEKNCKLEVIKIDKNFLLKEEQLIEFIEKYKPRILAITHCSNVLGTINDIKKICKIARKNNTITIVDAAQSVPHMKIDVKELGCDFLAFSGHKMLGPTGIGVLYGREELIEKLEPFMFGGDMIKEVHENSFKAADSTQRFEAGTPNIEGIIGLGAAVDYLCRAGMDKIFAHEKELIKYCIEEFERKKLGTYYGPPYDYVDKGKKAGVFSFTLKSNVHPHDIAHYLDQKFNIAIRSGHHCAQPLHEYLGLHATARASFYLYNTKEEIDIFIKALEEVNKVFM